MVSDVCSPKSFAMSKAFTELSLYLLVITGTIGKESLAFVRRICCKA
jgi:hypothetical protein